MNAPQSKPHEPERVAPRGEHTKHTNIKKPKKERLTAEVAPEPMTVRMPEIVPAILRKTFEDIQRDWQKIEAVSDHIQLDITDGIFAGEGTFREVRRFKQLPKSEKIELHMMVHTPANFVDDVIDLMPARCIFHLESFEGTNSLRFVYETLAAATTTDLALAINPDTPTQHLEEHLDVVDYVLCMGYHPGWANQPIHPLVFNKIREFRRMHPDVPIAVDGHVGRDTVATYVEAGATMLCANTAIFGQGNPIKNYQELQLLALSGR